MDGLTAWITALRGRLAPGELTALPPMQPLQGEPGLPGELVVRIMLADLDHYGDLPTRRQREWTVVARKLALLADLQQLCARIG
jgi:hypothetical protein